MVKTSIKLQFGKEAYMLLHHALQFKDAFVAGHAAGFATARRCLRFIVIVIITAQHYASAVHAVVVCPSVRLSHAGIVQKWLNTGSWKQYHKSLES